MDTSTDTLFNDLTQVEARALFIAERIELRQLEATQRLAQAPLTISAGASGLAVLFRYGAVVLFGVTPVEEMSFLKHLEHLLHRPLPHPETEQIPVVLDGAQPEGLYNEQAHLQRFSLERLQLIADSLAKSVVLAHYEKRVAQVFDRIEPLAEELQNKGRAGHRSRILLRHIGEALMIQHKTVGRVEIVEKPELLWEYPELERLYLRLTDEYELRDRHTALERKLSLISRTAETLLDLLQDGRSLRVEWYIVVLIVVEILLTLYEMFAAPA